MSSSPAVTAIAPAAEEVAATEDCAALRSKWRTLTLGEGFSPTAEPFKTTLATVGTQAAGLRDTMTPAAGSLWPTLG